MIGKPFHIAVNARFLLRGKPEGLGRFSDEVLKRMVIAHPEIQFSFFFDRKFDPAFIYAPNVKGYVLGLPARHPILWNLWFQVSVKRMLKKLQPDVFFSPDGFLCLKTDIPQVPVVHDLAFEHHPEDTYKSHAKFYRKFFPLFVKKASHIITVSEFSKNDIINRYGTQTDKISVAFNSANENFHAISEEAQDGLRNRITGGKSFFHYVGAIQPRKNIVNLLRSFAIFKSKTGSDAKLLIVGRMAWKFENVKKEFEHSPVKEDIIFTGFVEDDELNAIYSSSLGLCYIPFFEGFGIPLVEAMKCGCAIIAANTSSLPEVAGEAALLVDPADPEEIAIAMKKLWEEPEFRKGLSEKGLERSNLFSWERTAKIILEILRRNQNSK